MKRSIFGGTVGRAAELGSMGGPGRGLLRVHRGIGRALEAGGGLLWHGQTRRDYSNALKTTGSHDYGDEHLQGITELNAQEFAAPREELQRLRGQLQDVTIVDSKESAIRVLNLLQSKELRRSIHAWDTETVGVDPKVETPVGNGRVICATAYVGGKDLGNGPKLWIDNTEGNILQYFKDYFEDPNIGKIWHNYSFDKHVLENEGINCSGFIGDTMHMARLLDSAQPSYSLSSLSDVYLPRERGKEPMKSRFAVSKTTKSGNKGKSTFLPPTEFLQNSVRFCQDWIEYSTRDAYLTWQLGQALCERLMGTPTIDYLGSPLTLWDVYSRYWKPFAESLIAIERQGFLVNLDYLKLAELKAEEEAHEKKEIFVKWLRSIQPEAADQMNPFSDKQKQALLFAPFDNTRTGEKLQAVNYFKKREGDESSTQHFPIKGLKLPVEELTGQKWPSTAELVLRELSGDPNIGKKGKAFATIGQEGCDALYSLCEAKCLQNMSSTFLRPLQTFANESNRIHSSLNLNTETGRLSCRRPNLQNQPAIGKDRLGIRKAFVAPPGKKLIVADYAQLELRILAHMTQCSSMITAFKAGGDFHSRTAMGMYPHIREAVEKGEVLLEWDGGLDEKPDKPLLKDVYALERRRAKVLNFSIAYGKTAKGLAKDWGVTHDEAKATLRAWYNSRPEVREWQNLTKQFVSESGYANTILGRRRELPGIHSRDVRVWQHSLRAAINTPIQGSAADVVMAAMIQLYQDERLRELGWDMILQVHDEIILEGPEESSAEAADIVREILENPLKVPLLVSLSVSLNIGDSWQDAK